VRRVRRQAWRRALLTADELTPTTRAGLQRLAEFGMAADGSVVMGAERLAARLGCSQRQAARYLQAAFEHCWLEQTSAGYRTHSATYTAAVPDVGERRGRRPHRRKSVTESVTHSEIGPTTGTAECVTQSATERVSRSSTLSAPVDVTPKKRTTASESEHLAVNESADDETTTTAAATPAASPENKSAMTGADEHARLALVTAACEPGENTTAAGLAAQVAPAPARPTCRHCAQQLVIVEPGRDTCARCQYRTVAA